MNVHHAAAENATNRSRASPNPGVIVETSACPTARPLHTTSGADQYREQPQRRQIPIGQGINRRGQRVYNGGWWSFRTGFSTVIQQIGIESCGLEDFQITRIPVARLR